jgi:urea transport system permease protein
VLFILMAPVLLAQNPNSEAKVRKLLVEAVLEADETRQIGLVRQLSQLPDPLVGTVLLAWRQGGVFLFDGSSGPVPFLLETQNDPQGKARGLQLVDGEALRDEKGTELKFQVSDLTAADTTSRLRKAIKTSLDLLALANPDPKMRRDAVLKLGQDQDLEILKPLQERELTETNAEVKRAYVEAISFIELASEDEAIRVAAVERMGALRSLNSLSFLQKLVSDATANPKKYGAATLKAARSALKQVQDHQGWVNTVGTGFRGLSTSAVLLVAALGLAITFGLMGVINMAHGEMMMVGAYTTYLVQNQFRAWFGPSGASFDTHFPVALAISFLAAAVVGLVLERGVIRFLYKRPLESLLATSGVSLVLQQLFRSIFGAANVQVGSPSWLMGNLAISDVQFAYNRLFVIGFAFFVLLLTYLLLTRTSLGLQIRAVMQNRSMAAALGVRADRVNMMTFAFGSGLAGMAGACLSQLANVGPSLGQSYIVDCFMVVVLGGVGNLVGTVTASLGIGVTDQMLQPWIGAVLGKISVLAAIILFLQWRPSGIFATRSRSLEG